MNARRPLLALLAALVFVAVSSTSASAQTSGDEVTFNRSPASGPPGTSIAVSGKCLFHGHPTESVSVFLTNSRPNDQRELYSTSFAPGADGSYAGTLPVPITARADDYRLSASCSNGDGVFPPIDTTFRVTTGGPLVQSGPGRVITAPGPGRPPAIRVFGGDSSVEFLAYAPEFFGGVFVASGEFDGAPDSEIVTGPDAGGGPHVRVFGIDGAPRSEFMAYAPSFTGGVRVAAGNVDGAGTAEIITAPGPGGGPHVRVLRPDGSVVAEFMAYAPTFTGGVFVAAGDLDLDGDAEIVTAAGAGGGPHVRVFHLSCDGTGCHVTSGASFFAYDPSFTGGVHVAVQDVDGALPLDIVAGPGAGTTPEVRIFSPGATPVLLRQFLAYAHGFRGGVMVSTGAGVAGQTITGAGPGGGPHVRTFDDKGQSIGYEFYAYEPTFAGGVRVAAGAKFD